MGEVCPECRKPVTYAIQNGQCIECHDKTYLEAFEKDDDVSRSIVEEYLLEARQLREAAG